MSVKPWPSTITGVSIDRSMAPPPPVQSASVMSLLNSTNPLFAKAARSSASVETVVAPAGSDATTPHPSAVHAPIDTANSVRPAETTIRASCDSSYVGVERSHSDCGVRGDHH